LHEREPLGGTERLDPHLVAPLERHHAAQRHLGRHVAEPQAPAGVLPRRHEVGVAKRRLPRPQVDRPRAGERGPVGRHDDEVVGQHAVTGRRERREQAALARLPRAGQEPRAVAGHDRAGVESDPAHPGRQQRGGPHQEGVRELVGLQRADGHELDRGGIAHDDDVAGGLERDVGAVGADRCRRVDPLGDPALDAHRRPRGRRVDERGRVDAL
jgi:hypothetical protein